jgi:hypothetical protein
MLQVKVERRHLEHANQLVFTNYGNQQQVIGFCITQA